jgi:hypothetical protein
MSNVWSTQKGTSIGLPRVRSGRWRWGYGCRVSASPARAAPMRLLGGAAPTACCLEHEPTCGRSLAARRVLIIWNESLPTWASSICLIRTPRQSSNSFRRRFCTESLVGPRAQNLKGRDHPLGKATIEQGV